MTTKDPRAAIEKAASDAANKVDTAQFWLRIAYKHGNAYDATRARDALASALAALDVAIAATLAAEAAE